MDEARAVHERLVKADVSGDVSIDIMQGEELTWIVTAANNIQLDDLTQEYYMTNPDADGEDEEAERLQLEGAGPLTIDDVLRETGGEAR